MEFKEKLKKCLPNSLIELYSSNKAKFLLNREWKADKKKYSNYAIFSEPAVSEESIKSSFMFHAHSIEKGLSHPNFRPNFGKKALLGLKKNMVVFNKKGFSKENFEYRNMLSVLRAYKQKHLELGLKTPYFDSLFDEHDYKDASEKSGITRLTDNTQNEESNFFQLLERQRRSVRTFRDEPVSFDSISNAVSNSISTPSVCNRQPWNVYLTVNPEKIRKLIEIQGGYVGYGFPPALALVTVNLEDFRGVYERNEAYVDGGLFLMNLLLALTDQGLASCTLNMMLDQKRLNKIRKILRVEDNKVLIALVAIGKYQDEYLVPTSVRKNTEEVFKQR